MKNSYQSELDRLRLTAEAKEKLATALLTRRESRSAGKARGKDLRRLPRTVLAAALAIAVLAIPAGAAVGHAALSGQWNQSSQSVYRDYRTILDRSCTVDGWTMTLTDMIGDDYQLYIGVELQAPEGLELDKGYDFSLDFERYMDEETGEGPFSSDSLYQLSIDEETRTITYAYCLDLNEENSIKGQTIKLVFQDLSYTSMDEEDLAKTDRRLGGFDNVAYVVMTEKDFVFPRVTIDYPDSSVLLAPDVEVPYLDGTATLSQLQVSPLGITVELDGGSIYDYVRRMGDESSQDCLISLKVYGQDGEVLYENTEGQADRGSFDQDEGYCRLYQGYQTSEPEGDGHSILLDPETVTAVEVNGVYVEVGT